MNLMVNAKFEIILDGCSVVNNRFPSSVVNSEQKINFLFGVVSGERGERVLDLQ